VNEIVYDNLNQYNEEKNYGWNIYIYLFKGQWEYHIQLSKSKMEELWL